MANDYSAVQLYLKGQMQGAAIGQMIRQAALQQEAAQRAQLEFEDNRQINDIKTRMMLGNAGRRVEGGGIREIVDAPLPEGVKATDTVPGLVGVTYGDVRKTPVVRTADKSRTHKYKGSDGVTDEWELYTQDEQASREMDHRLKLAKATGDAENAKALDLIRGKAEMGQDPLSIAVGTRKAADARTAETRKFNRETSDINSQRQMDQQQRQFDQTVKIHQMDNDARDKNNRDDNVIAQQKADAADRKADAAPDKAAGADTRKELLRLRVQHKVADAAEHRAGSEAKAAGDQMKANSGHLTDLDQRINKAKNGSDEKNKLLTQKGAIEKHNRELESEVKKKLELRDVKNAEKKAALDQERALKNEAGGGGSAAPAAAKRAVDAKGNIIELRNNQWVKVPKAGR